MSKNKDSDYSIDGDDSNSTLSSMEDEISDSSSSDEERTQCSVCFEKMYISSMLQCPKCSVYNCHNCLFIFITEYSNLSLPACPACKTPFSSEYMDDKLPKKLIRELRQYLQRVLLAKEEALLPLAQQRILRDKHRNKIQLELNELDNKIRPLEAEYWRLIDDINISTRGRQGRPNRSEIAKQRKDLRKIERKLEKYREKVFRLEVDMDLKAPMAKARMKCPGDNCRGYLDDSFVCGLCETIFCEKCNQMKIPGKKTEKEDENGTIEEDRKGSNHRKMKKHVCKKEDIKSFKTILRETKPCPKCGIRIQKSEGCNQMWCISCHTAFIYNTGEIVTSGIHNPHYAEWIQRTGGQDILDNCHNDLRAVIKHDYIPESWILNNYLVVSLHVADLRPTGVGVTRVINPGEENIDLGIKYIQGYITKEKWGQELARRERNNDRITNFIQNRATYRDCTRDVLARYVNWCKENELYKTQTMIDIYTTRIVNSIYGVKPKSKKLRKKHMNMFLETLQQLEILRQFFNERELAISKRFNNSRYVQVDFSEDPDFTQHGGRIEDLYLTVFDISPRKIKKNDNETVKGMRKTYYYRRETDVNQGRLVTVQQWFANLARRQGIDINNIELGFVGNFFDEMDE